jgi:hypothetical protein
VRLNEDQGGELDTPFFMAVDKTRCDCANISTGANDEKDDKEK